MKSKIPEFYRESLVLQDPVSHWEFLSYRKRQYSMKVAKQKAHERKGERLNLEKKIRSLELQVSSGSSEELLQGDNKYKKELDTIYDYITEGIILLSKVTWYEYERNSLGTSLTLRIEIKQDLSLKRFLFQTGQ